MARAIVVIGLASFVMRETNIETEKKITTVVVAKSAPQKPGKPINDVETTIERSDTRSEGVNAPRQRFEFDSAILIKVI
jgi:hypothetical protein